jgi:hypothetical protein
MKLRPEGRCDFKKANSFAFHHSISTQTPWSHIIIRNVKELSPGETSCRGEVKSVSEAIPFQSSFKECGWSGVPGARPSEIDFVRRESIPSSMGTRFIVINNELRAESDELVVAQNDWVANSDHLFESAKEPFDSAIGPPGWGVSEILCKRHLLCRNMNGGLE